MSKVLIFLEPNEWYHFANIIFLSFGKKGTQCCFNGEIKRQIGASGKGNIRTI